jgi:hypothetical protein|tara:strand:+ start:497 stop:808 length:312 start_codon:yes stop_codon:yes gene_type:complete
MNNKERKNMNTNFERDKFTWDGMYLMYMGNFEGAKLMDEVHPDCHPSWVGKLKPAFIARFKYGKKPWKAWVNFLVKNATVEEYMRAMEESHPVGAMEALGYKR